MKNEFHNKHELFAHGASSRKNPKVSIGMPVYNGENYLTEALDSLLAQSFDDFELIISDNESVDATREICSRYSAQDTRIRYHRNDENRGAAWNFNHVFDLAVGDYFMWAAHDDLWAPEFLQKCVSALDKAPDAVLCYTGTKVIGEARDEIINEHPVNPKLGSPKAHQRIVACWRYPPQIPVFGLIRRDVLKRTRLIGSFSGSDRVLVSELALLGPFHGITDPLFFYRRHGEQSTGNTYSTRRLRMAWFDPDNPTRLTFPNWRLLRELFVGIWRSPVTVLERMLCWMSLVRWMIIRRRRQLLNDLIFSDKRPSRNQKRQTG